MEGGVEVKLIVKLAMAIATFFFLLSIFYLQTNPFALLTRMKDDLFSQPRPDSRPMTTARALEASVFSGASGNQSLRERLTREADVTVYFETERRKLSGQSISFGAEKDAQGQILYGEVKVKVAAAGYEHYDPSRPIADIPIAKGLMSQVRILDRQDFYLHIFPEPLRTSQTIVDVYRRLLTRPLIYVHGFNNDFSEEIWKAAKLKRDSGIRGPIIIFDWPSTARMRNYLNDRNVIDDSVDGLADFIAEIYSECAGCKLNVLAHSLGSRLVIRGLRTLSDRKSVAKIEDVVFAAPDVDTLFFERQLRRLELSGTVNRIIVYGSHIDGALMASRSRNGYDPVGLFPPKVQLPNMLTVDVSAVPQSSLGHDYFVSSIEVEDDIGILLTNAVFLGARCVSDNDPKAGFSRLRRREFRPLGE